MIGHDWMRKKDEDFRENYVGYIGEKNCAVLKEIHEKIRLDFFGLDFALLADGRLLLFECNPAMKYSNNWSEEAVWREHFAYVKKSAHKITDAFSEMVLARIRG